MPAWRWVCTRPLPWVDTEEITAVNAARPVPMSLALISLPSVTRKPGAEPQLTVTSTSLKSDTSSPSGLAVPKLSVARS